LLRAVLDSVDLINGTKLRRDEEIEVSDVRLPFDRSIRGSLHM